MKKKIVWALIILAVIIGGYFIFRPKAVKFEYETEKAEKTDIRKTVSVTGEIVPEEKFDLSFLTTGILENVFVEVGEKVKKGQVLASLNKESLNLSLYEAEATIRKQKDTLHHMKNEDNTYSKKQVDAQRETVRVAELDSEAIKKQIKDTKIYSPIDGIIIRKNFNKNEIVTASSAVVTVAKEGVMEIESNVPESDVVNLAIGQKADISFDALSEEDKFNAELLEIEPASTVIQDVVYYKVKFKILDIDQRIKIGMSVDIDINVAERSNVIAIPSRAITKEDSKEFVEIMIDAKNMITEKREIKTGLNGDDGLVEILSGLSEGEEVVTFKKAK